MLDCLVSAASMLVAWFCVGLELLLLVGLIARGRVRHSYLLFLLVLTWLASSLVAGLSPATMTWDAWIVTELGHALLAFLLAFELVLRAFRPVPRAWWWARLALGITLLAAITLVGFAWPGPISVSVIPWLLGALACLYVALWGLAGAMGMPQEPLHQAVLVGLSPYLIVYAVTWGQVGDDTTLANAINPLMFVLSLAVLSRAAWAREPILAGHPETVRWLFPWRF